MIESTDKIIIQIDQSIFADYCYVRNLSFYTVISHRKIKRHLELWKCIMFDFCRLQCQGWTCNIKESLDGQLEIPH